MTIYQAMQLNVKNLKAAISDAPTKKDKHRYIAAMIPVSYTHLDVYKRQVLAFSRPWPIFSPLYAYHAPLFSTMSFSTAKSSTSPSREIPLP